MSDESDRTLATADINSKRDSNVGGEVNNSSPDDGNIHVQVASAGADDTKEGADDENNVQSSAVTENDEEADIDDDPPGGFFDDFFEDDFLDSLAVVDSWNPEGEDEEDEDETVDTEVDGKIKTPVDISKDKSGKVDGGRKNGKGSECEKVDQNRTEKEIHQKNVEKDKKERGNGRPRRVIHREKSLEKNPDSYIERNRDRVVHRERSLEKKPGTERGRDRGIHRDRSLDKRPFNDRGRDRIIHREKSLEKKPMKADLYVERCKDREIHQERSVDRKFSRNRSIDRERKHEKGIDYKRNYSNVKRDDLGKEKTNKDNSHDTKLDSACYPVANSYKRVPNLPSKSKEEFVDSQTVPPLAKKCIPVDELVPPGTEDEFFFTNTNVNTRELTDGDKTSVSNSLDAEDTVMKYDNRAVSARKSGSPFQKRGGTDHKRRSSRSLSREKNHKISEKLRSKERLTEKEQIERNEMLNREIRLARLDKIRRLRKEEGFSKKRSSRSPNRGRRIGSPREKSFSNKSPRRKSLDHDRSPKQRSMNQDKHSGEQSKKSVDLDMNLRGKHSEENQQKTATKEKTVAMSPVSYERFSSPSLSFELSPVSSDREKGRSLSRSLSRERHDRGRRSSYRRYYRHDSLSPISSKFSLSRSNSSLSLSSESEYAHNNSNRPKHRKRSPFIKELERKFAKGSYRRKYPSAQSYTVTPVHSASGFQEQKSYQCTPYLPGGTEVPPLGSSYSSMFQSSGGSFTSAYSVNQPPPPGVVGLPLHGLSGPPPPLPQGLSLGQQPSVSNVYGSQCGPVSGGLSDLQSGLHPADRLSPVTPPPPVISEKKTNAEKKMSLSSYLEASAKAGKQTSSCNMETVVQRCEETIQVLKADEMLAMGGCLTLNDDSEQYGSWQQVCNSRAEQAAHSPLYRSKNVTFSFTKRPDPKMQTSLRKRKGAGYHSLQMEGDSKPLSCPRCEELDRKKFVDNSTQTNEIIQHSVFVQVNKEDEEMNECDFTNRQSDRHADMFNAGNRMDDMRSSLDSHGASTKPDVNLLSPYKQTANTVVHGVPGSFGQVGNVTSEPFSDDAVYYKTVSYREYRSLPPSNCSSSCAAGNPILLESTSYSDRVPLTTHNPLESVKSQFLGGVSSSALSSMLPKGILKSYMSQPPETSLNRQTFQPASSITPLHSTNTYTSSSPSGRFAVQSRDIWSRLGPSPQGSSLQLGNFSSTMPRHSSFGSNNTRSVADLLDPPGTLPPALGGVSSGMNRDQYQSYFDKLSSQSKSQGTSFPQNSYR